jgi:predicted Mrr-cat superfamily restriction endonuclease
MITCKNCEFEINSAMRHALVKNCCPCCGSALLGDIHIQRMELLKRRILEQEFSQGLNNDLVFDISLFLLTEFFPIQTKEVVDESEESVVEGVEGVSEAFEDAPQEEEYTSIRDEVRGEILAKMDDESEDADLDLKVARLKRIAKEKAVSGTGAAVRRVGD